MITTIDTLEFSEDLQKSGMKTETADMLAKKIKEAQSQSIANIATKNDIKNEILALENRLLIKLPVIIAFIIGLYVFASKL